MRMVWDETVVFEPSSERLPVFYKGRKFGLVRASGTRNSLDKFLEILNNGHVLSDRKFFDPLTRQLLRPGRLAGFTHRRGHFRIWITRRVLFWRLRRDIGRGGRIFWRLDRHLHRNLAIVADLWPRTCDRSGSHLHVADNGAGRIPELRIVGRNLQNANVRIVSAVPPCLRRR